MGLNMVFLIVDDQSFMRRTIRNNLRAMKYLGEIHEAPDGKQAISILKTNHVDVIISDWSMPEVTGLELLRYVRKSPKLKHIPFLMITAEGGRDLVVAAVKAGVTDFLVKPFTQQTLNEKIERVASPDTQLTITQPTLSGDESVEKDEFIPSKITRKPTILTVDDTPSNIDVITGMLKDSYKIKAAKSGEIALAIARSKSPLDLILLDIMMPEMDGYEVCRQLKEDPLTSDIPVIFLSAKSETKDMTKGFDLGAVDYITKPIDPPLLLARVKTHVDLYHSKLELSEHVELMVENARIREDVDRITKHDIKNPLSVIINQSSVIYKNNALTDDVRDAAKLIGEASFRTLNMINRTLDLYKMEKGTYQFVAKPYDLKQAVESALFENVDLSENKRLNVIINMPNDGLNANGDALLTLSILSNLLKNAFEASPQSGTVRVNITVSEKIKITINNKKVVPYDMRDRFFDKYATADKVGGTGLGTYSAKLMTEIQGGTIGMESSEEKGTTLILELPLKQSS